MNDQHGNLVAARIAQIAEEADRTADDPMPPTTTWGEPGKSVTISTRLSPTQAAEVEELARRLDVPVSALLRGWIASALESSAITTVHEAVDRLAADVERLREIVA